MGQKVEFMDIVLLRGRKSILGHREVEEALWDWELRYFIEEFEMKKT